MKASGRMRRLPLSCACTACSPKRRESGSSDLQRGSARRRNIGETMREFPLATAEAERFTDADAHINGLVLTSKPHLRILEASPEGKIAADIFLQDLKAARPTGLERSSVVAIPVGYCVGAGNGIAARAVKRGSAILRHKIVERGSVTIDVGFGGGGALGEELIEIGVCHGAYSWYRIVGLVCPRCVTTPTCTCT